jgi:TRAP-type transport system periplasmic protein
MKRRSMLQASSAVALSAPVLGAFAQSPTVLKFHTFMSPASNVWNLMHKPWM